MGFQFRLTLRLRKKVEVEIMKIGEKLKKTRIMLGLTQGQMALGVMTSSFYSRIERGINQIGMDDLIKILNEHHVSLRDFFRDVDIAKPIIQKSDEQIWLAYNDCDLDKLKKIKYNTLPDYRTKLELKLMIAVLNNQVAQLPIDLRQAMRQNILQIGQWNTNSLRQLALTAPLYSQEELSLLINSILSEFTAMQFDDQRELTALANVLLTYLRISFSTSNPLIRKVLNFMKTLPGSPTIFLQKSLASYFTAILNDNTSAAIKIVEILHKSGYADYCTFYLQG